MPIDRIRVMVSSRCRDYKTADGIGFALGDLRQALKALIQDAPLFGHEAFDCFINENEPAKPATRDLWDECMREVTRAHIVIVLTNGDAGWAQQQGDVGICHAELSTALLSGRDRTHAVQLPLTAARPTARDQRFRDLVANELAFTGPPAATLDEAIALVRQTLAEAVARLTRGGASLLRKDSYALGEALAWSRLNFIERKAAMEAACAQALRERDSSSGAPVDPTQAVLRIDGAELLFCVHAIPAATSTAAAREMVGRPFLADHRHLAPAGKLQGPIHVIACHRSATEKQATDLLGYPDATVVATTFGTYLVDPVQRIQLVLLTNCRDQTATRFAVQRLFDWLARSGQRADLVAHAKARGRIVRAIQKETISARIAP